MRRLLGAFRAEWLRLATRRAAWLLPLGALFAFAYAYSLGAAAERGLFGAPTGFYLAATGATGAALTCAAVGALLSASALGQDFASGVARTALCRPVGRATWLVARLSALTLGLLSVFLAACGGALLAGQLRFGLSAVTEGSYVLASAGLLLLQLGAAVASCFLGLAVAVAAGGVLGMLWGRPGPAVASTAVLGAGLLALGRWPKLAEVLPTTFLTAGLDRVTQLSQGLATLYATDVAPRALGVFSGWLVLFLGVGLPLLQRKDVTS
jgi:ABC-type transport system involved in multi-copper enzyme maturation permease subunit